MPTMQGSVSVAANSVSPNVLAGEQFEFLAQDSQVTFSTTGSVTGLRTSLLAGGVTLINDQAIGLQNRFPLIPDDVLSQEVAPAGTRLLCTFRNTTVGAIIAFFRFDINA